MKILYLRTHYGIPDSRCEKEMYVLGKKHEVEFLGWNRELTYPGVRDSSICLKDRTFIYHHIGIKAPIGGGFKRMFFPLIRFWKREWLYLYKTISKYDAIHICDFDAAFPIFFIRCPIPIVYDIYDYYADSHPSPLLMDRLIRRFESRIIKRANATIICSKERKNQIYPAQPKKLLIIHNSPPDTLFGGSNKKNRHKLYSIIYVGILSEDRFLREIAEVISNRDDCDLHIGGIGVLEHYFEELSQTKDNITYYGKMAYEDVLSLEQQCDIMIAIYDPSIPNHKYAAPNKFYEALMLKKPLIMMKNTGMDQYVTQFDLGVVIDGNKSSFRGKFNKAIDELISRKDEWDSMGERGYELYQEEFSWGEMERRLLNLYEDLEKEKITEDRN